ncbi:MAG: hypothetical protein ABEJ66_00370 [Candidatus Nanohaloarchaea archaeon]
MLRYIAALLLLVPLASGLSFGTYTVQDARSSDDFTESFSIGVMNPGERTLDLYLSAENSSLYNVDFREQPVEIEPGKVTENPSGSGWYYLGDSYIEVEEIPFTVEVQRYRKSLEIPVTVKAVYGGKSGTRVVYLREHVLRLRLDRSLAPSSDGRRKAEWKITGSREPEVEIDRTVGRKQDDGSADNYKQEEQKQDSGGEVNGVTAVLALGVVISLLYVLKVA